ncbi:SMI1/KNR4 family protein [Streptomyces sp. AC512_CC834]|uniref:SMI1/KNR4 family protein n=1 Tax=Streptomyces sp. AC512_CC834 TaxID=2823691 RepID=UPI001C25F61E|nr:SMI1/KNR4 family protein [Streptomyces sp. AC512_CC834]
MTENMQRLRQAWGKVEEWLTQNAPGTLGSLRPAATHEEIDQTEHVIGVRVPAVLRQWYRLHDGQEEGYAPDFFPGEFWWFPLEKLREQYLIHTQEWEREVGALPFAADSPDDYAFGLYVEAATASVGTWGVETGHEPLCDEPWPLQDWVSALADALEHGRPVVRPDGTVEAGRPSVDLDGCLTWFK